MSALYTVILVLLVQDGWKQIEMHGPIEEVLLGYILIGQRHINVSTLNPTGYMST